jgi:hypothetical protein
VNATVTKSIHHINIMPHCHCRFLLRLHGRSGADGRPSACSKHPRGNTIWREESTPRFGGKKFKIKIVSSIWREEIQNRNRLLDLAEEGDNRND